LTVEELDIVEQVNRKKLPKSRGSLKHAINMLIDVSGRLKRVEAL
jgi:hypothetical protein